MIGGTRGTGLLIAHLLHRQGIPIRVLARNPARAATLFDRNVHLVCGDVTRPETLPAALDEVRHIIFTAGCRSGYPVGERQIKATEFDGVVNTLNAARQSGFAGRFLYMTSSGLSIPSWSTACLNLWKGNTLVWRRRVEDEIRASRVAYTIIRTGILLNRPGGQRAIDVTQQSLPLALRYRIARADVAEVFVASLNHPKASGATFDVVWGRGRRQEAWTGFLDRLEPDLCDSSWTSATHRP